MDFILTSFLISLGINILLFIPAFIFKTDKLTDASYSISFITVSLFAFFLNQKTIGKTILLVMILLWALRLMFYLVMRISIIKKDKRFDSIREKFSSFIFFWIVQGISVFFILLCSIFYFQSSGEINNLSSIGIILWFIGLTTETIADYQKFKFKLIPKNKNKFIQKGLWKYSRHPNFFGEFVVWVGIFLFCLTNLNYPQNILATISPIFIFIILFFFSGIPPLEKKYNKKFKNNEEYKKYKKTTSIFIPLPKHIFSNRNK